MKGRKWTDRETEYLRANYNTMRILMLCKNLNRTKRAIFSHAFMNDFTGGRWGIDARGFGAPRTWTNQQIDWMMENLQTATWAEIREKLPNHTRAGILNKAHKIGLKRSHVILWTKSETEYLRENFTKQSHADLENYFNRSWIQIRRKAYYLGLKGALRKERKKQVKRQKNILIKHKFSFVPRETKKRPTAFKTIPFISGEKMAIRIDRKTIVYVPKKFTKTQINEVRKRYSKAS